jgi:hypothetical protein
MPLTWPGEDGDPVSLIIAERGPTCLREIEELIDRRDRHGHGKGGSAADSTR